MKKIVSLIVAIAMLCGVAVYASPFSDVSGHWAEEEIEKAYVSGSVNGDPDGRFRPDENISRGEFLKLVVAEVCSKMQTYIPDEYEDKSHWAAKYYKFATEYLYIPLGEESKVGEIVPGIMDKESFDIPVERWEMSFILSETIKNVCGLYSSNGEVSFKDAEDAAKNYPQTIFTSMANTSNMGIMTGDENGFLNPGDNGTRAEAVVVVNRMADIMRQFVELYEETVKQQEEYNKTVEERLKTYEEIPQGHPVVTIVMDNGKKIMIELYPEYAPQTVANFVELVKAGFYNGVGFHRVIDGFMAQGGDPEGTGMGGSENTIVGEFAANGFTQNTLSHTRGVISMARSQNYNSASSQFFICYGDASFLDGQYAAFGKVISGMNVIDDFLKIERTYNSSGELAVPAEPIVIKQAVVSK